MENSRASNVCGVYRHLSKHINICTTCNAPAKTSLYTLQSSPLGALQMEGLAKLHRTCSMCLATDSVDANLGLAAKVNYDMWMAVGAINALVA